MTGEALEAEAPRVDDTRDIALRAEAKAFEGERRLNTINGQIGRLGESHEAMRGDFNRALYGVGDDDGDGGLVGTVIELKATVTHAIKVAGAIVGVAVTITTGVTVYELEHAGAAQPPSRPKTVVHAHHQVSSRQRGLSGQLLAVQQHP